MLYLKEIPEISFIDRKEFNGSLYEQVDDAYHFVLRHIDMGAEIEGVYRFHHQGFFMVVWILKLPNPENRHAETRRLLKHFIICILLRHGEQDFQEL